MPSSSSTTTTKNNNHHHVESEQLPCPRCDSTNTKFCYYNNYNFSQPRHFCKSCRRYWTHGGALRDIPVGGGTRKSAKRQRVSSTAVSSGLEYHHISSTAAAATTAGIPVLMSFAGDHGGSFTSLLSNAQTPGIFGLDQDLSFGLGRTSWPFTGFGEGVGGAAVGGGGSTWGMESTEGGGDCFVFPDLAISTPGKCNAMK